MAYHYTTTQAEAEARVASFRAAGLRSYALMLRPGRFEIRVWK
ncbi:hypothetical protein [Janthinobacterium sp. CG_S6]|nr:hypothetical protein [Janthinobacterium sp. CG_S6]